MTGGQHMYTSTACIHGLCGSCRRTCKYCGASCRCQQAGCDHRGEPDRPGAGVDQARGIARELMDAFTAGKISYNLLARIKDDPGLFWLRGEEAPPGAWEAP